MLEGSGRCCRCCGCCRCCRRDAANAFAGLWQAVWSGPRHALPLLGSLAFSALGCWESGSCADTQEARKGLAGSRGHMSAYWGTNEEDALEEAVVYLLSRGSVSGCRCARELGVLVMELLFPAHALVTAASIAALNSALTFPRMCCCMRRLHLSRSCWCCSSCASMLCLTFSLSSRTASVSSFFVYERTRAFREREREREREKGSE